MPRIRKNPIPPRISERGVAIFLERQAELIVDAAEDVLSENHYPRGIRARYPGSAPGEAPYRRTGRLATRWSIEPLGNTGVSIRSEAEYSGYLERGTATIRRRPFVERIVERVDVLAGRFNPADMLENVRRRR